MKTPPKPLVEINRQAIRLLYMELGVIDAVRFLNQFSSGYGDYTKERDILFGEETLENIVSQIESMWKP